ncbi:MAG: acyl carrier protein [Gemmatimonadaceae bacterium]
MGAAIRRILVQHGRLAGDASVIADSADLYLAGLSSHASVNVMLALEGEFDVEFPDHMLSRAVFSSIASMQTAVQRLLDG